MAKAYVLYNPLAGNGVYKENLSALYGAVKDEIVFCDMTKSETYESVLFSLHEDDYIIICGGDGTLNCFINNIEGVQLKNRIMYYPIGSGNDFARDLGKKTGDAPFGITCLIKDLPLVEVNGITKRVLNGVGYGIDGYCCEIGDEKKKQNQKEINYTSIAIKGLLFDFKPRNAKVTVDGKTFEYKKVWIAPTMNGRYYGGGMIPTPDQDRRNPDGKLSLMLIHGTGKIKTLMIFPSIFKGEHVKYTECVALHEGYDITVEFDRPTSLQIDGETILGVTKYHMYSAKKQLSKKD